VSLGVYCTQNIFYVSLFASSPFLTGRHIRK